MNYGPARVCLKVWSDAVTTFQTTICAQPPLLTNVFLGSLLTELLRNGCKKQIIGSLGSENAACIRSQYFDQYRAWVLGEFGGNNWPRLMVFLF